ncbi:MAG: DsbA family protein [Bacteroidia bacterium]|nr:DsbA family protein [Bacteroidia bacterium]
MDDFTKFIYVGDPLCSWCYGISEELEKLRSGYKNYPFEIVVGGLRTHETRPMDVQLKKFLYEHWEQVTELSGQPFNYAILNADREFVYDTEKPCRAVVAFRHLKPESTLSFFKSVQHAFYRNNQDTNKVETYFPLLKQFEVNEESFTELFFREEIRKETTDDFLWARQVGANSFPTMLIQHNRTLWAIAIGYSTFDRMDMIVKRILNGEAPVRA